MGDNFLLKFEASFHRLHIISLVKYNYSAAISMNVSLSPMTLLANPMGNLRIISLYFYSKPFDYPYNDTGLSLWYGIGKMAVNVRRSGFEIV